MNYLNLQNSTLVDVRVRASVAEHVAAWLQLLSYCIVKENSGVIRNALSWSDKEWLHTVAVDKATMTQESKLWRWRKNDLVVWEYPLRSQKLVVSKRVGGRLGARRKWAKKKTANANSASRTPDGTPTKDPSRSPSKVSHASPPSSLNGTPDRTPDGTSLGVLMRKGKERKGIGKKGKEREKEVSPEHAAEILFELYPRHVGKRAALTTISSALERVSYFQLRARVQAFRTAVDTWPPEQLDFCPNPATWFREGRYDDDPETWAAKPPRNYTAHQVPEDFNPNAPYAHTGGVPVV